MLSQTSEQQITTIPFFVSSGSTHLADIRFALGLSEDSLLDTKLSRIFPKSQIIWGKAMDSHPFILE
ncbi:hypothetical protein J2S74_003616 [Evansella vedderi]|uniref:Uncharacterized protein n=1 Tax=Evansella vedderi TaxID=38282 RepID=A0ABT9ZY83_9BACI|nr:hypothetical protein [Evansella vedderi]MDQ0256198.1 hypothetical protein [Evansella vedderi]